MHPTPDGGLHATLDRPLPFRTLLADELAPIVKTIRVADDVELYIEVDVHTWEKIWATGTFHLDDEDAPAGFDAEHPIRLRLRLRTAVAARYNDAESLLAALASDASAPLRHSEAWYATEVTQPAEVPGEPSATVEFGIRTRWANPLWP